MTRSRTEVTLTIVAVQVLRGSPPCSKQVIEARSVESVPGFDPRMARGHSYPEVTLFVVSRSGGAYPEALRTVKKFLLTCCESFSYRLTEGDRKGWRHRSVDEIHVALYQ